MNYKYVLTKTTYYNGEHTRTSYGIAVINAEDNVAVLGYVEDITNERDKIANLVELCNAEKLEMEHLQSIVDDFLYMSK